MATSRKRAVVWFHLASQLCLFLCLAPRQSPMPILLSSLSLSRLIPFCAWLLLFFDALAGFSFFTELASKLTTVMLPTLPTPQKSTQQAHKEPLLCTSSMTAPGLIELGAAAAFTLPAPLPGQDLILASIYSHTSLLQSCLWAEKNAPNFTSRLCGARLNSACYCGTKTIRKVWYFSPHPHLPEPWWLLPFDLLIPALLGKHIHS